MSVQHLRCTYQGPSMDLCVLSCVWLIATLWPGASLWNFPGNNTGMSCHFLLQGIFPICHRIRVFWVSCIGRGILYHWATWEAQDGPAAAAAAAAKSLQSFPTLCDPMDGSPPGSPIPGILQARTLEWVAISSFRASKWKVKMKSLSHVRLLATPWTAAHQAPLHMGLSRQECWSGVPLPWP